MKKNCTYLLFLAFLFIGCSSNDDDAKPVEDAINPTEITLQEKHEVSIFNVLNISSSTTVKNPNYEWVLTKNPLNKTTDSIVGNSKDLRFIALYSGTYELTLNVLAEGKKGSKKTIVNVTTDAKNYNPYITSIFDFDPAPGMFANDLFKVGFTKEDVTRTALGRINETNVGYQLDLGGFGGSIIVGFDHTVINVAGESDFKVYGGDLTDKANPPAPGLIYVAYDKNGNGKPDDDEWYEIIGSQHTKENTIKNFKITYHKKAVGAPVVVGGPNDMFSDREHIFCENNQSESYYMPRSKTKKEYYPLWAAQNTVTYEGTKLNVDFVTARPGQTTLWNFTPPQWGYANAVNPNIDIDWAVDKNGKKANLPGINFIKIVNCVSEPMGLCHQQSSMATKFAGAADLHLLKKYNLKKVK
ncbi:hypothetical protein OIU80_15040 [Flavobacterium sp. LS1R47]|jgi:hypothetical protein|uniref:PKD domain-containing protein n=1 Tax=Flavobacterium frigoritolerans TaxID=2987686 RepID=A0A9X3C797_9FLAO|nr:hypothetical protein [Flavobacterium frigoritolerans]MCV9933599.1 hypothetical protein [Flavobacterium frigoritolerans]